MTAVLPTDGLPIASLIFFRDDNYVTMINFTPNSTIALKTNICYKIISVHFSVFKPLFVLIKFSAKQHLCFQKETDEARYISL